MNALPSRTPTTTDSGARSPLAECVPGGAPDAPRALRGLPASRGPLVGLYRGVHALCRGHRHRPGAGGKSVSQSPPAYRSHMLHSAVYVCGSTVLFMCVVPQCCLCVWLEARGEGERKREREEKEWRERVIEREGYTRYTNNTHILLL